MPFRSSLLCVLLSPCCILDAVRFNEIKVKVATSIDSFHGINAVDIALVSAIAIAIAIGYRRQSIVYRYASATDTPIY